MNDYNIRKRTVKFINKNLDDVINRYCHRYEDNIGFLLFYPLIYLEVKFKEVIPNCERAIIDREITNWFIEEILRRNIRKDLIFTFKRDEFEEYRDKIYPQLKKLYSDYRLAKEINNDVLIERCKVKKIGNNKYNIITPLIEKCFNGGNAYYHGIYDLEVIGKEKELANKPMEYIIENYCMKKTYKKATRNIRRLAVDIDKELYEICVKRVDVDTSKMGDKLKSTVINKKETLNNFLGFLYYLSSLTAATFDIEHKFERNIEVIKAINIIDIEWLKNKIKKLTNMNEILIQKYIDYFIFNGEGTIIDFPLIQYREKLIILPSSIMLNDWQFSITNGHYARKIEFTRKEKNISKSIVDLIHKQLSKFNNILVEKEYYYEVFLDNEKINSDIDIAIYDSNSKSILIIECKWKHNHYIEDSEENYAKIQDSLNKIYTEQISKHKKFINENINNVNKLFKNKIELKNDEEYNVYYLAVDKRSDLHINNQHMISVYTLLAFCAIYSESNILDLEKLIKKIYEAETKVEYFMLGEPKEFCIDQEEKLYITSDELYGEFEEYFK